MVRVSRKVSPGRLRRTRLAVYERCDFRCLHCGFSVERPDGYDGSYALARWVDDPKHERRHVILELDHIHPFSLGGTFTEDNLQALCNSCNARKGVTV